MDEETLTEDELTRELAQVYDQVPATCCASSGECCALTSEEFEEGYATMYPLYRAEHQNIVAYVKRQFTPERQKELLDFTEERPHRCPFLGEKNQCTIYPVRPLICRTYAVMDRQTIAAAAEAYKGRVPDRWIRGFAQRESGMLCPRVRVMEPEKLERHAHNLITSNYEQILTHLSRVVELGSGERREWFRRLSGWSSWPLLWTWGGFNTLRFSPLHWIKKSFKAYWKKAELAERD
jgi:Fe-S-cluster containining protein